MAKNRSRRLRKKMHIDEFQEVGFSVAWRFPEGTTEEQIDQDVDEFISEVIEPNKLAFDGSGYLAWEGLICKPKLVNAPKNIRRWFVNGLKTTNSKMSRQRTFRYLVGLMKGSAIAGPFCLYRSGYDAQNAAGGCTDGNGFAAHADYKCSVTRVMM
jgi:uncharacterized protein YggL (DUF469 family)